MRELEAELARYERFPEDSRWPNGTVIRFRKELKIGYHSHTRDVVTHPYTYVVLKVGADRWYITGKRVSQAGVDPEVGYDALLDFLADVTDIEVVMAWGTPEAAFKWNDGVALTAIQDDDVQVAELAEVMRKVVDEINKHDRGEVEDVENDDNDDKRRQD
jgi:hypothetical protein